MSEEKTKIIITKPFDMDNIKSFEEMKEELGDNYNKSMYDMSLEFLKGLNKKDIEIYNLQQENEKLLQKLVYVLSPTNHYLSTAYNCKFKEIIRDNIDLESCKIKKLLKDCWEDKDFSQAEYMESLKNGEE